MNPQFWSGKRVLLTGHTGFKGAWLTLWLQELGATVVGLGLNPATDPSLYEVLAPWPQLTSIIGDVRDEPTVGEAMATAEPDIVFHMAAQSLVRRSYADPVETFATNTMGTVHLLNAVRTMPSIGAALIITSDKVYDHAATTADFVEEDRLGGSDPYSASKAIQELVTAAFAASYFAAGAPAVATCRAGNVIGGGDWAPDRLIPDFFRALDSGQRLELRHPGATRPWQHVLDPLHGYLMYAQGLYSGEELPAALNFGPDEPGPTVAEVITRLSAMCDWSDGWDHAGATWPERAELRLDSSAATKALDWRPALTIDQSLEWTSSWYRAHGAGDDMREFSVGQIRRYVDLIV